MKVKYRNMAADLDDLALSQIISCTATLISESKLLQKYLYLRSFHVEHLIRNVLLLHHKKDEKIRLGIIKGTRFYT